MTLGFRTRTRAMNRVLVGSCMFSTAAFVLTYILAEDTEQYFAWTVQPPLSAAFFGAGYGAGALLAGLSLRERSWARIRPGVLAIIIFATLTLVVTLLHRDRFHFGAGGFAEGSAWLWLAIYVVFPIAGVIALVTEWRALGSDPPQAGPIPPALRGILAISRRPGFARLGASPLPRVSGHLLAVDADASHRQGDRRMAAPPSGWRACGWCSRTTWGDRGSSPPSMSSTPSSSSAPLARFRGGRLEPLVGLGAGSDGGADPGHRDRGEGGGGTAPSR